MPQVHKEKARLTRRPTFGAVYCVYDDDGWLSDSLESVYSECDLIYMLVSNRPWNGGPSDNSSTLEIIRDFQDPDGKIRLVRRDWENETDQRNDGLAMLDVDGIDYCFIVDADEIYDPAQLREMKVWAAQNPHVACWHMDWYTYWKSHRYCIEPREPFKPAVFVKIGAASFDKYRAVGGDSHGLFPPEVALCHHMSYARSDAEIEKKISSFSHADEILPDWYERIWKGWDRDHFMRDLHPVRPEHYGRAVRQDPSKMPPVLRRRLSAEGATEPIPGLTSIVIVTHDRLDMTCRCLHVLTKATPEPYEVIVVDNGSSDGTAEFLRAEEESSRLRAVFNRDNLGFGRACNQGATVSLGEYLLFLNNDTAPKPGWLGALVRLAGSDSSVGAVGAKLMYPDGQLQEAGAVIFSDASGWNYGRGQNPDDPAYNYVREVDYCSGACLLVRASLFERLGGFDRRYDPAYYEDSDLCMSIRKEGFKVLYQPEAVVIHHEGATAGTDLNVGYKRYQGINRAKFAEKWATTLVSHCRPDVGLIEKAANRFCDGSVLVIDRQTPLYDQASGSRRLFELLKMLVAQRRKITFIARNGKGQERYIRELRRMGIEVYSTDPERLRRIGVSCPANTSPIDLAALLDRGRYELAILSFFDIADQYLPEIRRHSPETRILIDTVDVHFVRELRQAELYEDAELREKALKTKEQELAVYREADGLICVTDADRRHLLAEIPSAQVQVIPNIHDLTDSVPGWSERQGLLFVGGFRHPPNADAVLHFYNEILPLVREKLPDVPVTVVGVAPPPEIAALNGQRGVKVTGYVPDIEPYLASHRVSIAPLRYGAGLKGKVCSALAAGLPVVTTSIGAEGMELPGGQTTLAVADTPERFADVIVRLYENETLWNRYSEDGRRYVDANYSSRVVATQVEGLLGSNSASQLTSIVILAHNQLSHTMECLKSIRLHTPEPHETIIVDNGSTDGTRKFLRRYLIADRNSTVVSNLSNKGFAAGNNLGIALARGSHILLLNNDTIVTAGWLSGMLSHLARHPEAGIVGPMSNYVTPPQRVPNVPYRSAAEMHEFANRWRGEHAGESHGVPRVVGFCLLAKREVFDAIGGLDERFGSGNFEDDDFCHRAKTAGLESRIAGDVFIHHTGSQTFKGANIDWHLAMQRNWQLFREKWGLPEQIDPRDGYCLPAVLPETLQVNIPLPPISATHTDAGDRWWQEENRAAGASKQSRPIHVLLWPRNAADCSPLVEAIKASTAAPVSVQILQLPREVSPARKINELMGAGAPEHLILLSSDVTVTPGALDRLVNLLESDGAAAAGPRANEAPKQQRVRVKYKGTGKELRRYAEQLGRQSAREVERVHYLAAFCLALRTDRWREIGNLREDVPIPDALMEAFSRLEQRGHGLLVARDAYVHHEQLDSDEGATLDSMASMDSELERALGKAMQLGEEALGRGDLELAAERFQRVVAEFPGAVAGHAALGSVLLGLGRVEESVVPLLRATELAPGVASLSNQLGVALYQNGDLKAAEEEFLKASEVDPEDVQPLLNLVELQRSQERYEEATKVIKEALRLDSSNADVLVAFGALSLELGDPEGAEMASRRIEVSCPQHPDLVELRRASAALREAVEQSQLEPAKGEPVVAESSRARSR